jgi:VWFA-related protein
LQIRRAAWRSGLVALLVALNAGASAQQPIFRSSVRLVEANVLVHDRDGRPVSDLKASDFTIFEDGKEQKLEVFAVDVVPAAEPPRMGAANPVPEPRVFSNRLPDRTAGGVTVVLFDRLNSTLEDQKQARDQILKFLTTIQPNERIAFYVLESDAVTVLHDFTSDPSRLVGVINRYMGNTSVELAGSDSAMPAFAPTGDAVEDAETIAWLERATQAISENFMRRRAQLTSQALEGIANHLAGVPGRKSLVWVSGAFPLVIPTEHGTLIMNKEVNRATRAFNEADVAVYPVDVRGLIGAFVNPALSNATNVRGAPVTNPFTTMATTHPSQDTMRQMAEATGGRVFLNTNAIGTAVRRAIDDSRVSYLLGYYSSQPANDNKYRSLNVKVNRSGVNVRHRKGYLALAPAPPRDPKARLAGLDPVMTSPIAASAIAISAEIDKTSARDGTIVMRLDPASITWDMKNGLREGAIDVVIAQSEPDGKYYKIKETTVNLTADADRYRQMQDEGFTLSMGLALRPNAYRIHVVVSDVASQAVGSLIIPIKR